MNMNGSEVLEIFQLFESFTTGEKSAIKETLKSLKGSKNIKSDDNSLINMAIANYLLGGNAEQFIDLMGTF